jgi:hypothetical protein
LLNVSRQRLGCFTVWRNRAEDPLLIDINLLTGQFQKALTQAIEKVMPQTETGRETNKSDRFRAATG